MGPSQGPNQHQTQAQPFRGIRPVAPLQLANDGGFLLLRDAGGARIDRVAWDSEKGSVEGKPVIFAYRGIY